MWMARHIDGSLHVRRYEGLEYMESIIYFPYIPYLIDIVIFYIDGVL
jgi:hypothetical protein